MFYWIYDIPTWKLGLLFSLLFVGSTWAGILFISPFIKMWLKGQEGINDLVGYCLSAFGVFYGLLLGLLAVATYQNASDVESTVVKEASSLAALYRDISAYPEPHRTDMQRSLVIYGHFIVEKAWPAQQRGENLKEGGKIIDGLQAALLAFEPGTKSQEIIHAETFRQFNDMILLRRQRVQSIATGIPGIMWYVVAVGAIINTLLILCFRMRLDIHLILGGTLSFFVGVLIFLIAAMDHPFRGQISVGPEAFQVLLNSLSKEDQIRFSQPSH